MGKCSCSSCQRSRAKFERPTKSLGLWIRRNRAAIDTAIKFQWPQVEGLNDEERRLWVLNDEGLYTWAKGEGVNV